MDDAHPQRAKAVRERGCHSMYALRDGPDAPRSVIDGVHARHDREERLRRTDVARRLLATDVLLARLKRHAQRAVALRVDADADDAAGELSYVLPLARKERRVGAAVSERHAEALGAPERDVRAELSGRHHQRQRKEIAGHRDHDPRRVGALDEPPPVIQRAVGAGVLQDHAEELVVRVERTGGVADQDLDAVRRGARPKDFDRLRVAAVGEEDGAPVVLPGGGLHHVHGFRRRGGFIEQRSVRDLEGGQVADHRLKIEQRLEAALRDLGLVGRVLRVPTGVLQHVALDDRRRDAVGVPHPEEAPPDLVLVGDLAQLVEEIALGQGARERQRPAQADRARDRLLDELLEGGLAGDAEHLDDVAVARGDVSVNERVRVLERNGHGR